MDFLNDLLKSKQSKEMDPTYKDAKMDVLKQIRDLAAGEMGNDVKGLKKVTVAAPDQEGLEKGLDKAKDIVNGETGGAMADMMGDGDAEDALDGGADEAAEDAGKLSPEEEALLAKLLAKKKL
jgi:hypothetical protein